MSVQHKTVFWNRGARSDAGTRAQVYAYRPIVLQNVYIWSICKQEMYPVILSSTSSANGSVYIPTGHSCPLFGICQVCLRAFTGHRSMRCQGCVRLYIASRVCMCSQARALPRLSAPVYCIECVLPQARGVEYDDGKWRTMRETEGLDRGLT
jgi:hypothetical protein